LVKKGYVLMSLAPRLPYQSGESFSASVWIAQDWKKPLSEDT
jgi:hypothetical protein